MKNHPYKVLCIGVNRVPLMGMRELDYAEKDARATAQYFKVLKDKAEVILLTGKDATRQNILNRVKTWSAIQTGLNIIIFFAGHGTAEKDENSKRLERCLWIDSNPNSDISSHRVKTSEILALLNNPLHRLIFITDACYNLGKRQKTSIKDIFEQFNESERITGLKHYVMISASAVNKVALEDPQLKHGVLGYYFLKTISGQYSFFLSRKIKVLRFLAILDKQVRNHRFLSNTGRKLTMKSLRNNGIMVHYSGDDFDIPILEPRPFIRDPGKNFFQQEISSIIHMFTCVRLRARFYCLVFLLGLLVLLLSLVHVSVMRIHFDPRHQKSALFHDTPWGVPEFRLDKIDGSNFMKQSPTEPGPYRYKNFNCYFFKHNWTGALLRKLDERGRIVLQGNLQGVPITGVPEDKILDFALWNNIDIFYWHPGDIVKTLSSLRRGYKHFNGNQVRNALTLLAKTGKTGEAAAQELFDFKGETFQRYRDLFLEHFYSPGFWEQHFRDFKPADYLYLLKNKKTLLLPHPQSHLKNRAPDQKNEKIQEIQQYLDAVARNIPDFAPGKGGEIVNREGIYGKLGILAFFGSPHFQEKASDIFQHTFNLDEIRDLFWYCRELNDKIWLLEQFLTRARNINIPQFFWTNFIDGYINKLPATGRSHLLKRIIDSAFQLVPRQDRYNLMDGLKDVDPNVIRLSDWEKWMKKYQIDPFHAIFAISRIKSPRVFSFLRTHLEYFKGNFGKKVFDNLYETDPRETVKLVKKLCAESPGDKFTSAVFLVNKNYHEYAPVVVDHLKQDKQRRQYIIEIGCYFGTLTGTLMRIAEKDEKLKDELQCLLADRKLFYGFYPLLSRYWPQQARRILMTNKITQKSTRGIPLKSFLSKIPTEPRKEILIKLCIENTDEKFKSGIESVLAENYPEEFINLVYSGSYVWQRSTREHVIKAFQSFSLEMLKPGLEISLKQGVNWNVRLISQALVNKVSSKEIQLQDLRDILKTYNRPEHRIMIRNIRHYINKSHFNQLDQQEQEEQENQS